MTSSKLICQLYLSIPNLFNVLLLEKRLGSHDQLLPQFNISLTISPRVLPFLRRRWILGAFSMV